MAKKWFPKAMVLLGTFAFAKNVKIVYDLCNFSEIFTHIMLKNNSACGII